MLNLIKLLLVRAAVARYLLGTLGSLAVVLPVAAVLKAIGAPVAAVLGVVAVPILAILLVVGLPIFAVLLGGAALVLFVALFLAFGLVVLKIGLFVVLPIMLLIRLVRWIRGAAARQSTRFPESA